MNAKNVFWILTMSCLIADAEGESMLQPCCVQKAEPEGCGCPLDPLAPTFIPVPRARNPCQVTGCGACEDVQDHRQVEDATGCACRTHPEPYRHQDSVVKIIRTPISYPSPSCSSCQDEDEDFYYY